MKRLSQPADFFIGAQYYRAPTPLPDEWEGDLRNVKSMDFNVIQLRPQWRWHERKKGEFRWGDLDKLFDLAEKNGLGVCFKFMLETAPAWLYREYDCARVGLDGNKLLPTAVGSYYVGGWLPCFDHRGVRAEATRFIEAAVGRYKERKNLLLWNVWNEPRSRPIHECCCSESKRSYREWLKERFSAIEDLNSFFGKAWGEWEDIDPPGPKIRDYAEMYLWRQWAMHSVADRVRWVYDLVKKHDDKHPVFTHAGCCSVIQDAAGDSSDDWLNARQVDFYGSSLAVEFVPTAPHHYASAGMICDWIRCVSPYYWINELYPNRANWMEGVRTSDLNARIWTCLAHGAKGILFWQYRSERLGDESNGHGLVDMAGKVTKRSEVAARSARIIKEHGETFRRGAVPQPQVAILYDHHSDLISRIQAIPEYAPDFEGTVNYPYKYALTGSYSLFWNNDIPVDWLSSQELNNLDRYRLIYLPLPYIVTESVAAKLADYVRKGGTLISESCLGLRAENTWANLCVPPHGLDEIFGCREAGRRVITKPMELNAKRHQMRFPATRMFTWLEASTAEPIGFWKDGAVAVASHQFGRGRAILLGMSLGCAYADTQSEALTEYIRCLSAEAGVKPAVSLQGVEGFVRARVLETGEERLIFLFNYGETDERVLLVEPLLTDVRHLFASGEVDLDEQGRPYVELSAGETVCMAGKVVRYAVRDRQKIS